MLKVRLIAASILGNKKWYSVQTGYHFLEKPRHLHRAKTTIDLAEYVADDRAED